MGLRVSGLPSNPGNPETLYPYPAKPGPLVKGSGFKWVRVRVRNFYPGVTQDIHYSQHPCRPTQANEDQQRVETNESSQQSMDGPKRCDTSFGPGMFLFSLLFILLLLIYDIDHHNALHNGFHESTTTIRRPRQTCNSHAGQRRPMTAMQANDGQR